MKNFLFALLLTLLAACALLPFRSGGPTAHFLLSGAQHLELEPCGCSIASLGGVHRLFNYFAKNHVPSFAYLSAGTAFLPLPEDYHADRGKLYELRRDSLIEVWNQLGLTALTPSVADFTLGIDRLQALQKKAQFTLLSANVVDSKTQRPVLRPYLLQTVDGGAKVLVIGLSGMQNSVYGSLKGLSLADPVRSIQAAIKEAGAGVRLVVLLSSADQTVHERVRTEIPEVSVLLDGTAVKVARRHELWSPSLIYMNTKDRSRDLVHLQIPLGSPIKQFFNESVFRDFDTTAYNSRVRLTGLEKTLSKVKPKERKSVETNIAATHKTLDHAAGMLAAKAKATGQTDYEFEFHQMDSTWDLPTNAGHKLVEDYKKRVHDQALEDMDTAH